MISKGLHIKGLKKHNTLESQIYSQTKTGTANAIFPTSSSACMIFLIRACQINTFYQIMRLDYKIAMIKRHYRCLKMRNTNQNNLLSLLFERHKIIFLGQTPVEEYKRSLKLKYCIQKTKEAKACPLFSNNQEFFFFKFFKFWA